MLRRSFFLLFTSLVRQMDPNGFVGDFRRLEWVNHKSTQRLADSLMEAQSNVLLCGHYGTGKLTALKAMGERCERLHAQRVAYVSADVTRASRLDGYLLHHFLGLRVSRDDLPSREQIEGALERHVRLCGNVYDNCVPCLGNVDVLVLDAAERVEPAIMQAMDAVARRVRSAQEDAATDNATPADAEPPASSGKAAAKKAQKRQKTASAADLPFGGLRIFAAADFWQMPNVHPSSDSGGYLFQLDSWEAWFPVQKLLTETHNQSRELRPFTSKALLGELTEADMAALEAKSMEGKPEAALLLRSRGAADADEEEDADEEDPDSPISAAALRMLQDAHGRDLESPDADDGDDAGAPSVLGHLNDDMISNAEALTRYSQRFLKQPAVKILPQRYRQLKQTEMGNFLINMLLQSCTPLAFGLVEALSVDVGSRVHLVLDGSAAYGVPAGAVGEVTAVTEHHLTIHFGEQNRTVDIPRVRVTCHHPYFPEIEYEIRQFPVFPRNRMCPTSIRTYPNAFRVNLDGHRMADTNDLGNLLARMRGFHDFTLRNVADFVHLDGMTHEPTRIYYHRLTGTPLTSAAEYWCRNCKAFVPTAEFPAHWAACVRAVRWCAECSKTVPLELLEPHREKHQIVLCMDCGQAVEWRHWEAHRLSCAQMMREISTDNELLPLRTRQLALELGLDKRDLHTMRSFSRSLLPKPKVV